MPKEQQQFLEEVEQKVDVLEAPLTEEKPGEDPKAPEGGEDDPEKAAPEVKNRRHRRLEERLQAEREANIQLTERLKNVAEAKNTSEQADYLKSVEKIYGTDSPEAVAATEILKKVLTDVRDDAETRAYNRVQEERRLEAEAVKKEEKALDSMVDELEDEFNISFTPEMEKSFFKALEKVSPKNEQGDIVAYADHFAVWEDLQSRIGKKTEANKAKTLAARSMTSSAASPSSKLKDEATENFLKQEGII